MTDDASPVRLVRLELENQLAAGRALLAGDPSLTSTYGTAMDTIAGLPTSFCAVWDYPVFNRVLGAGIFGPLDERGIDAVARHYSAFGRAACVETYRGITSPSSSPHCRRRASPTRATATSPTCSRRFARPGSSCPGSASGGAGPPNTGGSASSFATVIASADGEDAGTGQLALTDRVAGCYSGSVVERFRGRGIQKAVIAARVEEGLRRGHRIFISQTDPDSPSGHNLHDLGFRTLYRATWYTRPA